MFEADDSRELAQAEFTSAHPGGGVDGENFRKAIAQFRHQGGLPAGDEIDEPLWLSLGGDIATDVIVEYTHSAKDVAYDFADEIPRDYAKQAKMKRLSYTSAQEMFGERFDMSEALLKALNPRQPFDEAGARV